MGETLPLPNRSTAVPGTTPERERTVLHHSAHPERRAVLRSLADEGQLPMEDLAAAVTTRLADGAARPTDEPSREAVTTSLYHTHLYPLAEAGLIEHDGDSTVALSPSVDPELVTELTRAGEGEWASLKVLLSEERRQRVVATLSSSDGSMSLTRLAETVAAIEGPTSEGPRATIESVRVALHHVDLPKLADVGVVTHDVDDDSVELASVPDAYRAYVAGPGV